MMLIVNENGVHCVVCTKCDSVKAFLNHILNYLGLNIKDIFDTLLLVLDFLKLNELMDLV